MVTRNQRNSHTYVEKLITKQAFADHVFFSLQTFYSNKEDRISRKNYYQLNTDSFFDGKRFDMKGERAQSVANGHNNVIELEVYLVKGNFYFTLSLIFKQM